MGDHIATAASRSNVIVVSDRVYVSGAFENYAYDDLAVANGLEIILYTHHTFKYWWFDPDQYENDEDYKML